MSVPKFDEMTSGETKNTKMVPIAEPPITTVAEEAGQMELASCATHRVLANVRSWIGIHFVITKGSVLRYVVGTYGVLEQGTSAPNRDLL